mmetsp:Transcript_65181/g.174813  ORF Transcript_65181/g.174813 Transcript_65181/m.174813 type:complete len:203 (-) Transcript_65181:192-800(-)
MHSSELGAPEPRALSRAPSAHQFLGSADDNRPRQNVAALGEPVPWTLTSLLPLPRLAARNGCPPKHVATQLLDPRNAGRAARYCSLRRATQHETAANRYGRSLLLRKRLAHRQIVQPPMRFANQLLHQLSPSAHWLTLMRGLPTLPHRRAAPAHKCASLSRYHRAPPAGWRELVVLSPALPLQNWQSGIPKEPQASEFPSCS